MFFSSLAWFALYTNANPFTCSTVQREGYWFFSFYVSVLRCCCCHSIVFRQCWEFLICSVRQLAIDKMNFSHDFCALILYSVICKHETFNFSWNKFTRKSIVTFIRGTLNCVLTSENGTCVFPSKTEFRGKLNNSCVSSAANVSDKCRMDE